MHFDVVIIGAGQSGLALGYFLKKKEINFTLLESEQYIGNSWRKRYDSLKLFSSYDYSHLPGLRMKRGNDYFPTKNEMATYLEEYAKKFELPILYNTKVISIKSKAKKFIIESEDSVITSRVVVIATGGFNTPNIPQISKNLSNTVFQIHSTQYTNPSQIPHGKTLVVGAGNSGAQIASELANEKTIFLSASHKLNTSPQEVLGKSPLWWLDHLGLMNLLFAIPRDTFLGEILKKRQRSRIIGTNIKQLIKEGLVKVKPKVINAHNEVVVFRDQSTETVNSIIWATGFTQNFSWIDIPELFDDHGNVIHSRGTTSTAGLYFLGLDWQYSLASSIIAGIQKDAKFIADHIAKH